MSNKNYDNKESKEENFTPLADIDAVLADAGTAFFNKQIKQQVGKNIYQDLLSKHKGLTNTRASIKKRQSTTAFKDKDIDYYKNILGGIKKDYYKGKREIDSPINISLEDNTIFSSIVEGYGTVLNYKKTSDEFYNTVRMNTKSKIHKNFTEKINIDKDKKSILANIINDSVDDISKNTNKYIYEEDHKVKYKIDNIYEALNKVKLHDDKDKDKKEKIELSSSILNEYVNFKTDTKLFEKVRKEQYKINTKIKDEFLDYDNLKKTYGHKKKYNNHASIKDILKNKEMFKGYEKTVSKDKKINLFEELEKLVKKDKRYENLIVDKNLKVNKNGKVYSDKELKASIKAGKETLNKSPIANFFNARGLIGKEVDKEHIAFNKGHLDHILAAKEGYGDRKIRNNYHYINNKFYIADRKTGQFVHMTSLDDYTVISNKHGIRQKLLKQLTMEGPATTDSKGFFDVRKKYGSNKKDNLMNFLNRKQDPDWEGNLLTKIHERKPIANMEKDLEEELSLLKDSLLKDEKNKLTEEEVEKKLKQVKKFYKKTIEEETLERYKDVKTLSNVFRKSTKGPNAAIVEGLKNTDDPVAKRFAELMNQDPEEVLEKLVSSNNSDIQNTNLKSLLNAYLIDPKATLSRKEILTKGVSVYKEREEKDFKNILNRELTKEMFMRIGKDDYERIYKLIDESNITGENKKNLEKIAALSIFQKETGGGSKRLTTNIGEEYYAVKRLETLLTGQNKNLKEDKTFINRFQSSVKEIFKEDYGFFSKGKYKGPSEDFGRYFESDYSVIKKAISPIEALNDKTKRKAFLKQFTAGKDDPENITTATLIPYFFADRLNKALDPIGLSLSGKDASSTQELLLNLGVKRILPAVGGMKALSYLDYRLDAYTGMSLRKATANTIAGADIGFRKVGDITGLTTKFKRMKSYNPILEYITGSNKFHSSEERKEYYQKGKSPVRSGRFFSFGSLSEFRGGKINYYQPNWFQRMYSDAKDISIYGSVKEKWKYSWLPTPRHPLAPLRRLIDPYRIERRNYWDRPYAKTGDMFGHTFPGSGLLNMSIGRILKPRINMHKGHSLSGMFTGDKFIDSRAMLAEQNKRIKERANANLVQLNEEGQLEGVTYNPLKSPGTQEVNIHIEKGKIDIKRESNDEKVGVDFKEFNERLDEIIKTRDEIFKGGNLSEGGKYKSKDILKAQIRKDIGDPFKDIKQLRIKSKSMALNEINKANKETLERANQVKKGIITKDQIFSVKASDASHLLQNKEVLTDLRNVRDTKEYLSDTGYQIKKMTGMYGFTYDKLRKKKRRYTLDDASKITSSSRSFWDRNLGGLGGRPMHFVRRIIPHEDRSVSRENHIRNMMPEWMPDRFKFGDPYAIIPKGEMRLPGEGYKSMFELHPDKYGKEYGAFDRMKILADVAPWSKEYKLWRDIAQKEIQDPDKRREMKEIKRRVEEQSKQHDFYNYKFKGVKTDSKKAVISQVMGSNSFKVQGDDQVYRLARIDELTEGAEEILKPGMQVNLTTGRDEKEDAPEKAAIVHSKGQNINKLLVKQGLAIEGGEDTVMDHQAFLSGSDVMKGKIWETIAHADIPIIHKKFLRIESPLESYKSERVYGTKHSTWSNPIKGWLKPLFQESVAVGPVRQALGLGLFYASRFTNDSFSSVDSSTKKLVNAGFLLSNKGALVGAGAGLLIGGKELSEKGATIGALAQTVGYTLGHSKNITRSTINTSMLGGIVAHQLLGKKTENALVKGAGIGALTGLLVSGSRKSVFNKDDAYIPEETKRRWELDEYFDRLKYIKYMGLYEKAARKAKLKEGVDVRKLVDKLDAEKKKNDKRRKDLIHSNKKISNRYNEGTSLRNEMDMEINHKLSLLESPDILMKTGEYTKSALAYKQAAESTIYGLKEDANWAQILRALPKNERDYMLEFAKEQDPKKRKEILKMVSPYQRKVLELAWGEKVSKQESNLRYFTKHHLPNGFWSGWNNKQDLDKIKLKTIKNEGMLLSDFGYYESELQDPEYLMTPSINKNFKKNYKGPLSFSNLFLNMKGMGINVGNVTIQPSKNPGIKTNINIKRSRRQEVKRGIARKLNIPLYI